ncbi:MAG: Bacteriophage family, putative packaging [Herbinix sp.]|nr:Bacteriophage family, putative packaging [Herbinix sp.]
MLSVDLIKLVKANLKITNTSRDLDISDLILEAQSFCNIAELPATLEPWLRKKVKTIINYEAESGTDAVFDVKSIHEGDTTTTYNVDQVSKETIYGLSEADKAILRRYRGLRK